MSIIIKFIVASEENAHRVSKMAIEHYTRVAQQKDIDKEYSVTTFLNSANSFTREWLMSFAVTGEDEDREEQPLAFMELVSANIPKTVEGGKPLYIEKSIYTANGEGLKEVLNRAIEIAKQRRHDSIWAEIPKTDTKVKEVYEALGFEDAGSKEDMQLLKKAV